MKIAPEHVLRCAARWDRLTIPSQIFQRWRPISRATPSRLLVVAMEDVLGILDQPNIPGTVQEHPNWRRRLPVALEDIAQHQGLAALANIMTAADRG